MKKLLAVLVLGLLWCNIGFADNVRIVDGDTIEINGEKIRFSGIDAPEYKQDCINGDLIIYCGMFSKVLLTKKIGNETKSFETKEIFTYSDYLVDAMTAHIDRERQKKES